MPVIHRIHCQTDAEPEAYTGVWVLGSAPKTDGLTFISALAPGYRTLLLLRGLSGLGMAPAFTMPYALLSKSESPRQTTYLALSGRRVRRTCVAIQ